DALALRGAAGALDAYRAALDSALSRKAGAGRLAFRVDDPRLRALVDAVLGSGEQGAVRYRRALAAFLADRKLWPQAVSEWQQVIADVPADAAAHPALGAALASTGHPAEGPAAHRRAVELDPRSGAARIAPA